MVMKKNQMSQKKGSFSTLELCSNCNDAVCFTVTTIIYSVTAAIQKGHWKYFSRIPGKPW